MAIRVVKHQPEYWRITFNNPPINLMDSAMLVELQSVISELEANTQLKVVLFDSSNPDYFIAHYDLLDTGEASSQMGPTGLPLLPDLLRRIEQLEALSIASIRGRARGVGAEFVAGMDVRFGSTERCILGQPEVGCGVIPGGGGSERLPRLVGRSRALEIVCSGYDYDAKTASEYGWINRSIADQDLDDFVNGFCLRVASFSRQALGLAKGRINASSSLPLDSEILGSLKAFLDLLKTDETQTRIQWLLDHGFQKNSDLELLLGSMLDSTLR